jgi:hypothetical protein
MLVPSRATNILLILVLAVGIGIVAMLATRVRGGPLDPPGTPASTMHTLDDSPVVWDRSLSSNDGSFCNSSRFKCVLGGAGMLDRETGLVWQQTPPSGTESWYTAVEDCMNNQLGGRYGWRLPRIEEYRSLLDETGLLPVNVFANVQLAGELYWSSSTVLTDASMAILTRFDLAPGHQTASKLLAFHVWCVRGGAGLDGM